MVLFHTNSHFQYSSVPFERISLINFFSLVLPRGWGFRAFSHVNFCPGGWGFVAFLPGVGISLPQKISQGRPRGGGVLTAGIAMFSLPVVLF